MSTAIDLSAHKDARHLHFLRVINSEFSNRGTITSHQYHELIAASLAQVKKSPEYMAAVVGEKPATDPYAELKAAFARGEVIECAIFGQWTRIDSPHWLAEPDAYRIRKPKPLKFPAPPEGREWFKISKFTPESFGVGDGFRPLVVGEALHKGDEYWSWGTGPWTPVGDASIHGGFVEVYHVTFRTKRPLPMPPKRVPLAASDIPPVCWVRCNTEIECMVMRVLKHAVFVSGETIPYERLAENYKYSTDRKTWQPCSKEVAS